MRLHSWHCHSYFRHSDGMKHISFRKFSFSSWLRILIIFSYAYLWFIYFEKKMFRTFIHSVISLYVKELQASVSISILSFIWHVLWSGFFQSVIVIRANTMLHAGMGAKPRTLTRHCWACSHFGDRLAISYNTGSALCMRCRNAAPKYLPERSASTHEEVMQCL